MFLSGLISLIGSLLIPICMLTCNGKWKLPQSSPTLHELIGPKLPETKILGNI